MFPSFLSFWQDPGQAPQDQLRAVAGPVRIAWPLSWSSLHAWSSLQPVPCGQVCRQWLLVKFACNGLWSSSFLCGLPCLSLSCPCLLCLSLASAGPSSSLQHGACKHQPHQVLASGPFLLGLHVLGLHWRSCLWVCVCVLEVLAKLVFLACLLACNCCSVLILLTCFLPCFLACRKCPDHKWPKKWSDLMTHTGLLACLLFCTAWSDQVPPLWLCVHHGLLCLIKWSLSLSLCLSVSLSLSLSLYIYIFICLLQD